MKVNIMQDGDRVISVTHEFVAVERASGEVDIVPLVHEDGRIWVDTQHILTIGYGENTVQVQTEDGVTITTF